MRYMLLIVEPPGQRSTRTLAEGQAAYDSMRRFGEQLQQRGQLVAVESLASTRSATRVARQGEKVTLLDGPFAEAKEMVGGFFMIEVDSREQALAIAAECPASQWCQVEVRPLAPCFDDSI
ncbi:dehydrogenase [Rhizobacter sp. AJA081-3]|uniref:YciI family protein n=1 Tax=Rhizobacter sp. AJA081-3 TaxID=2753607 RepID=UPI001ADFB01E|nr:YciI family protein [Rhizobacter sp. AJA081-3]QTN21278.1 dehydrogenase [Rhizobacter sp. AJA081-3]